MNEMPVSANININLATLPKCPNCENGELLPFCDETKESKNLYLKAWACSNKECKYFIKFDRGDIVTGETARVNANA